MLDILFELALEFLKWCFSLGVLLSPIFILVCNLLDDIARKKESDKRYDIIVTYKGDQTKFPSVRYEFSRYSQEVHILFDNGIEVWVAYELVEIFEVK